MVVSISEIMGLRKKLVEILNEPTFDKVCKGAGTILIVAGIIKVFVGFAIGVAETDYNFVIFVFVNGVILGIVGFIYKYFDMPVREQENELKKDKVTFDNLIQNPKLKATEMQLDRLDAVMEEMDHIRILLATVLEQKTDGKINEDTPLEDDDEITL